MNIDKNDINFQSHWEADVAKRGWMSKIDCKEKLIEQEYIGVKKMYQKKQVDKLRMVYGEKGIKGFGLESAFSCGTSLYWISKLYPETTYDAFDFNYALDKIIPFIKEIHGDRLKDIWIGNAMNVPKPDNHYEWINSCDFYEHVPEEAYWLIIKETYRLLKPNGILGVYVGQPRLVQHIRIVPPEQTKKELESVGFKAITNYLYTK